MSSNTLISPSGRKMSLSRDAVERVAAAGRSNSNSNSNCNCNGAGSAGGGSLGQAPVSEEGSSSLQPARVYLCFVSSDEFSSAPRGKSDKSDSRRLESRFAEGSASSTRRGEGRERDLCASQTQSSAGSDTLTKDELRSNRRSLEKRGENSPPHSELTSQEPVVELPLAKLKVASTTKLKRAFARIPSQSFLSSNVLGEGESPNAQRTSSPRKTIDSSKHWWPVGKHWFVFYWRSQRLDPERSPAEYNMQTSDPSNPVVITVRSAKLEDPKRRASRSRPPSIEHDDEPVLFRHIPWAVAPSDSTKLPQQRSPSTTPLATPRKRLSLPDSSHRAYDKRGAEFMSFTPPPPLFRSTSPTTRGQKNEEVGKAAMLNEGITASAADDDDDAANRPARLRSNTPRIHSNFIRLPSTSASLDSAEPSSSTDRNKTARGGRIDGSTESKTRKLSIPLPRKRSIPSQHPPSKAHNAAPTERRHASPAKGETGVPARNLNGDLRRCASSTAREARPSQGQSRVRTPSTNRNSRRTSSAHQESEHALPPFVVGSASPRMTYEERERSLQLRQMELQRARQPRDGGGGGGNSSTQGSRQSAGQRTPSPRKGAAPSPHGRDSNRSPSVNHLALHPQGTNGGVEQITVTKRPQSARVPLRRRTRSTLSPSKQAPPRSSPPPKENGIVPKNSAAQLCRYASSSSTLTDASSKNSQAKVAHTSDGVHPPAHVHNVARGRQLPPPPPPPSTKLCGTRADVKGKKSDPLKSHLLRELSDLRSRFDSTVEQQEEMQRQAIRMMKAIASLETENAQLSDLTKQLSNAALARASGSVTTTVTGSPSDPPDDSNAESRHISSPPPHLSRHLANSPMQPPPQRAYTQSPIRLASQPENNVVEVEDFVPNTTHMEDTPNGEKKRATLSSLTATSSPAGSTTLHQTTHENDAAQLPTADAHEESVATPSSPNRLPPALTSITSSDAGHPHSMEFVNGQHHRYSASQRSPGETSLESASHSVSSRSRGIPAYAKRSYDDVRSETGSITSYQTDRLLESSIDTWSPANPTCISPYYRGALERRAKRRPAGSDAARGAHSFKHDTGVHTYGSEVGRGEMDALFEERYGQQLRDSGPPPELLPIGDEWEDGCEEVPVDTKSTVQKQDIVDDEDAVSTPQRPSMPSENGLVVNQARACSSPPSEDDEEGPTPSPQPLAIPMQSPHANHFNPVSRAEEADAHTDTHYSPARVRSDGREFFRQNSAAAVCNRDHIGGEPSAREGGELADSAPSKPWKRQPNESNPRDSGESLKLSGAHMFTSTFSSVPKDQIPDEPRYTSSVSPSRADHVDDMESDHSFASSCSSVFGRQVRNEMDRLRAHLTSNHIGAAHGKEDVQGHGGLPQRKAAYDPSNLSVERPPYAFYDPSVSGSGEKRRRYPRAQSDHNTTLSPTSSVQVIGQARKSSSERVSSESAGPTDGRERRGTAEGTHRGEGEQYADSRSTCSIEYSSSKDTSDSEKQRELLFLVDELSSYNAELEKDMRTLARKLQLFVSERRPRQPSFPSQHASVPQLEE